MKQVKAEKAFAPWQGKCKEVETKSERKNDN
jgi:hypothetical protein